MILPLVLALTIQSADFTQFVEQAEETSPAPAMDEIRPLALGTVQRQAAEAPDSCTPDGIALEAPRSATADAAVIQAIRARQVRNAWTVQGQPLGCPGSPRMRFLVTRRPDNSAQVIFMNFGESLANVSLLRQTAVPAAAAALAAVRPTNAACRPEDVRFGASRIVARGADLSPEWHGTFFAGSWQEAWTFSLCDRRVEVPITFTANGQGGAVFDVRAAEARILEP